ncbi:MAG: DUF1643 domain-containing protein [Proteobacteria bacterium]|nr:DUF1643 domain-containing protein [Pseudomonadota bacterium]
MSDLFVNSGAEFSRCRMYRYRLWRHWGPADSPPAMFLMLNPSTADENANDPTVERCQRRAYDMGYAGLTVGNIFALRSTDPKGLYVPGLDPVGPENNQAIIQMARSAGVVICAWGRHGNLNGRGATVLEMIRAAGITPHCLKMNQDGTPQHPLYLSYDLRPKAMEEKQ